MGFEDEIVKLDRPLVNEVTSNVDPTTLSDRDLREAIITSAYIGISSKTFVDELIWREGESQSLWFEGKVNPKIEKAIYNEIAALYPGEQNAVIRCDKNVKQECNEIAKHGSLRMLKWAHKNGFRWDECTCIEAAIHGHLEILKYLHDNGCPWDSDTCAYVAMKGYIEICS